MALSPVPQSPRHTLLPMEDGTADPTERFYAGEDVEGANGTYRLTNQHHVIGDSDDEIDGKEAGRDDTNIDRRDRWPSTEEHQELIVSDSR